MKSRDERVDFYYRLVREELSVFGVELVSEFDKKICDCSLREVFLFLEEVAEQRIFSLAFKELVTKFYWECL